MAVIGGRAHINGITFVTNTHIVRGKLSHGTVSIKERRLPALRIFNLMDKVPFLRGIALVAKLNHKLLLAAILVLAIPWDWLLPKDVLVVSESVGLELVIYSVVSVLLVVLLKRLWRFHGAEHKVLNVYMSGGDLSLNRVRRASRVSERCGTNLVVIALPIIIVQSYVTMQVLLILVVALTVGYGIIYRISGTNCFKPAFLIGSFLQKYIVTAEPTEAQIQLAYATISRAIECGRQI